MNKVATGVPRSGTHFLSTILGWPHERFYRPGPRSRTMIYTPEVSWAAAPFVKPDDTLIFQIVRHPLKVIASNIHRDWLKPDNEWGRFAHQWSNTWSYWEFFISWYELCDSVAQVKIRLEDIAHLGDATNQYGDPATLKYDDVPDEYRFEILRIAERDGYDLFED